MTTSHPPVAGGATVGSVEHRVSSGGQVSMDSGLAATGTCRPVTATAIDVSEAGEVVGVAPLVEVDHRPR
jgi:hypothetical protein